VDDTLADPDAAYEICKKYVDGLADLPAEQAEIQRKVLDASISFWRTDSPGESRLAAWQNMHDLLIDMGLLKQAIPVEQAYSNDFLPKE
jgi:NitT/TauT family transport system substrate-binding protein